MKNLIILIFILLSFSEVHSQTAYWTVYDIKVNGGEEAKVLGAFDNFFKTDSGKSLPAVTIQGKLFGNSQNDFTHRIVFSSPNKSDFGKMYSGAINQDPGFQVLGSILNQNSVDVASYMGFLISPIEASAGVFSTVYSVNVTNLPNYLSHFNTLKSAVDSKFAKKYGLHIHQMVSGNEPGQTHVIILTAASLDQLMLGHESIGQMPEFATFSTAVQGITEVKDVHSMVNIKTYNTPE